MNKSLLLTVVLAAIIAANAAYFLLKHELSKQDESLPATAGPKPAVVPPPMELLGQGARMPTPEERVDEAHYDDMQVAKAGEWVKSPQVERRIAGAEQLSAFQTPESEQILSSALTLDSEPEVRRTAAQSLAAFRQPAENTMASLLAALGDPDEKVQMSALNALMAYANRFENNSVPMKKLMASLKKFATSRRTTDLTRKAIRSFLKDQAPPSGQ
jgi:HEAT repeat protein